MKIRKKLEFLYTSKFTKTDLKLRNYSKHLQDFKKEFMEDMNLWCLFEFH